MPVSFPHQPFDPVSVYGPGKFLFGNGKHDFNRNVIRGRCLSPNQPEWIFSKTIAFFEKDLYFLEGRKTFLFG